MNNPSETVARLLEGAPVTEFSYAELCAATLALVGCAQALAGKVGISDEWLITTFREIPPPFLPDFDLIHAARKKG